MLSLAGDAPLPADPGGPPGMPMESLQPLAVWFRGKFRATLPAVEVRSRSQGYTLCIR